MFPQSLSLRGQRILLDFFYYILKNDDSHFIIISSFKRHLRWELGDNQSFVDEAETRKGKDQGI